MLSDTSPQSIHSSSPSYCNHMSSESNDHHDTIDNLRANSTPVSSSEDHPAAIVSVLNSSCDSKKDDYVTSNTSPSSSQPSSQPSSITTTASSSLRQSSLIWQHSSHRTRTSTASKTSPFHQQLASQPASIASYFRRTFIALSPVCRICHCFPQYAHSVKIPASHIPLLFHNQYACLACLYLELRDTDIWIEALERQLEDYYVPFYSTDSNVQEEELPASGTRGMKKAKRRKKKANNRKQE